MQKVLRLWICFSIIIASGFSNYAFSGEFNDEYYDGKLKGEMTASARHSTSGNIIGGGITGFLFGLIGTGIGIGIIALGSPSMPPYYEDTVKGKTSSYKMGFVEGYRKKAKSKSMLSFFYSGLTSAIIAGMIITANTSDE